MDFIQAFVSWFLGLFMVFTPTFGALPVQTVPQGGTGRASFTAGECLVGNGTGPLTTQACGGGGGTTFSTTSANFWSSAGLGFSTTSANFWSTQRNFFSTSSTNFWSSFGLGWATTSANFWEAQQPARFDFTPNTNFNSPTVATTTSVWFQQGIEASSTSYFSGFSLANLNGPLHANAGTVGATSTIGVVYGGTGASTLTGLVIGNGTSAFTAYAGGSCTNQFLRALSSTGGFTCASVALGTDVSGTLGVTNGGTGTTTLQSGRVLYGGATSYQSVATGTISAGTGISISATVYGLLNAASVSLNQAANLVWTGNLDFGGATGLEMPNGTAPVADAIGEFALDTTSNLVVVATSTSATAVGTIPLFQYPAFTVASSSAFNSTNTRALGTAFVAENWLSVQCYTDVGTAVVRFGNGVSSTTAFQASTTIGTVTLNYAFSASNRRYIDIGSAASSPTTVSCTLRKMVTRD